jgi:hypothetical protein
MKLSLTPLLFVLSITLYCCSPAKEENADRSSADSDTTLLAKQWLYGLWSEDSGNTLSNSGFYIRNDGTIDMALDDASGSWELVGLDTIKIKFPGLNKVYESNMIIDSLSEDRMVLHDSDGIQVFRKVPFGINNEGQVIQGFSGYVSPGTNKDYFFEMPPAKKVMLKMYCPDSSVTFRLYDDREMEITSTGVRNWAGIVIRSGKYHIALTKPKDSKLKEEADFDLKVLVY